MKFYLEKAELSNAVLTALRAAPSKSPIPALEGLLIKAGENLSISGYNLEIGITHTANATVLEPGEAVFSARLFSDIVRKLPNDNVYIETDDENRVNIKCGLSSFDLTSLDPEEFPEMPVVNSEQSFEIAADKLKSMISKSVYAVAISDIKPILTGSLFDIKRNLIRIVSTDNFRLAVSENLLDDSCEDEFSFIVPATTLREIEKILKNDEEKIKISLARKHMLVEIGNTVVISRLLEGQFFKYESSMSLSSKNSVAVNTKDLLQSVERVTPVINEKLRNPIKCKFEDGAVKISYVSAVARAYDECAYEGTCENIEIGLSNRYLLDALHAVSEEEDITLEFNTASSPLIIKPSEGREFFYMIAPVRPQ